LVTEKLADNALNARLPRHFADGRNGAKARGVGFLREGGDQDPPSLKPPLEVLETFGGAKVSDDRPAIKESEKPKHQQKKQTRNPKIPKTKPINPQKRKREHHHVYPQST
jgi:hypothetical protein